MKGEKKKKKKTIIDNILEFNYIRGVIIILVSFVCVAVGSISSMTCSTCAVNISLVQTGYLMMTYVLLTVAYNLSKKIPVFPKN